jgi:hypothetical protein
MQQAIEECGDGPGISEELAPISRRTIRRQQRRGGFVAAPSRYHRPLGKPGSSSNAEGLIESFLHHLHMTITFMRRRSESCSWAGTQTEHLLLGSGSVVRRKRPTISSRKSRTRGSTTYAVEVRYSRWPDRQVVEMARFRGWLAVLDDFRNFLIREAA